MRFLALLIVLTTYPALAQRSRVPSVAVVIGSSSACGPFGQAIASAIREETGQRVRSLCHSATGLARPDAFDWQEEIENYDLPATRVVLLLGGNDAQGLRIRDRHGEWDWIRWGHEAEWRTLYAERTRALVDAMCDRGATSVVVVLPPPVLQERLEGRLARVRESMEAGTRASRCGSVIATSEFATATDADGNSILGRHPERQYLSDGIHLSRSGSSLMWFLIGTRLLTALSLPSATDGL